MQHQPYMRNFDMKNLKKIPFETTVSVSARHGEWFKNAFNSTNKMYKSYLESQGFIIPPDETHLLIGLMYSSLDKGEDLSSITYDATIQSFIEFHKYRKKVIDNYKKEELKEIKAEGDKRKNYKSDMQKKIAQEYLIKNQDVWKEEYKGDQDPFVRNKVLPYIRKSLGISEKDCLSSRQLCQSLNWHNTK